MTNTATPSSESKTRPRKIDADVETVKSKLDVEECMEKATAAGKSAFGQTWDVFRLGRTTGMLDVNDYYYYRLYDDSRYSFADKTRFASERFGNNLLPQVNDVDWHYKSVDKYRAYEYLESQSFLVPETQAIVFEGEREFPGVPNLKDVAAFERFLKEQANYPIYFKPVYGIGSIGNFLVTEYNDGEVTLLDGSSLSVQEFYDQVDPENAYLIQSLLDSNESMFAITPRLITVRVILVYRNGHPQVIHTICKIPSANSIADNYWRKGNMLANVDSQSGRFNRVVTGTGPWLQELETHPETGTDLVGFQLPYWSEIIDVCIEGAKTFSPLRFQSWDIGLTPGKPTVVEVNSGSAMSLPQLATGEGFLSDEFLAFMYDNQCKMRRVPKFNKRKHRSNSASRSTQQVAHSSVEQDSESIGS